MAGGLRRWWRQAGDVDRYYIDIREGAPMPYEDSPEGRRQKWIDDLKGWVGLVGIIAAAALVGLIWRLLS